MEIGKEFVIRIVMCLIELRAVKEIVRIIAKYRLCGDPQGASNKNCKVPD